MVKNKLINFVFFVTVLLSPFSVYADSIGTLKDFNNKYNSVSGDFTQIVTNSKKTQKTSGKFSILRPKFFKWEYKKPYQQIIIGDGQTIWLYDVDLAQVVKQEQNKTLGDSPASILADKVSLNSSYTLKNDGVVQGVEYVLATPKYENSGYQYLRIGFKNNELYKMILKDSFGNTTDVTFSNLSNKSLNANQFKFKPPKGVDILTN